MAAITRVSEGGAVGVFIFLIIINTVVVCNALLICNTFGCDLFGNTTKIVCTIWLGTTVPHATVANQCTTVHMLLGNGGGLRLVTSLRVQRIV